MNSANPITFYGGGYNCFSNFSAYKVFFQGEEWMTSEHAYQAQKFESKDVKDLIRNSRSALEAKEIALQHKKDTRDNWFDINESVMEQILRAKLQQHEHIHQKLKETGEREIIEASDDSYWGWGRDHLGENKLGKLWMKLRQEIRK